MKYRGIFEYEYPTEHKPPVSIDVHLHGDCVKGKIIEWEYRPLEQEPCGDAISREQAVYVASGFCDPSNVAKELAKLPSVNPVPCEDAISRQAVEDAIYEYSRACDVNYAQIMEYIDKLPPVKPQEPKMGHWIEKDGFDGDVYYDCSVCGESWTTIEGTPWDNGMKFCPNCGARMKSEEDEE